MSVGSLVRSTTLELSSNSTAIPATAHVAFLGFHYIHRVWRWIRLGEIYTDPDNFAKLTAGHGVNYLISDSVLIRISALTVLITARILHCVSEYEKLQNSWLKMHQSFSNQFPSPVECDWNQKTYKGFFSVSTVIWIKTSSKTIILRIQRIAICIFKVGKHAFLLSMRLIDTIEAFSLSPSVRNEGINLLLVNSSTCISKMIDNKELLLERLESNEEVTQKILSGIGSQLTADQLTETVRSALNKTESIHSSAQTVNESIGEFVSACGKKWTYELFREIGLHHLLPKSTVPPAIPPWEMRRKKIIKQRFPPLAAVTKLPEPPKPQAKQKKETKSTFVGMKPLSTKDLFVGIKLPITENYFRK